MKLIYGWFRYWARWLPSAREKGRVGGMTYQAYLDNIEAQTGKTPEDFLAAAKERGMVGPDVKVMEIVNWLKKDYGLGHGHAMAIVLSFRIAGAIPPAPGKKK